MQLKQSVLNMGEIYSQRQERLLRLAVSVIKDQHAQYAELLKNSVLVELAKQSCKNFFYQLMPEFSFEKFQEISRPLKRDSGAMYSPIKDQFSKCLMSDKKLLNQAKKSVPENDLELVCDSFAGYITEVYERINRKHVAEKVQNTYQ